MKKIFLSVIAFLFFFSSSYSQKIIPIEYNGQKYEILDMTAKGKLMWGGYEEILLDAAKSENNGADNTMAIVLAVGKNSGYEEKPYAATSRLCRHQLLRCKV